MNLEGMEARELLEHRTKEIDVLVPADEVRRYIITEPDYSMDMESAVGEIDNQAVTGLNLLRPSHFQQLKRSKRLQIMNIFSKRRKPRKIDSSVRAIKQPSSKVRVSPKGRKPRKTDSSRRAIKQPSSSKGRPSPKKSCRRGPFSKTCEVCGKTFTRCLVCEKSFRDGHNLKRHQKRVCEKELNMLDEDKNEEEMPQPSTSKPQITSLLKTPSPPGPSHLGTLDTITASNTCSVCGRYFARTSSLVRHMSSHSKERPFGCVNCDKRFKYSYLVEHERVHSGEYPYQCSVCQAKFNKANSLTIHSRKHTGEKPFLCWQCGKSYKDRGNLSMHMGTHSEEKPFSCSQCDMTYRTKIQGHENIHVCIHICNFWKIYTS
uniref:Zinc finger protein 420-like n=1 Tax=Salmo trutta TaxID=8032 RepID=A0A674DSS2_SALTR